MPIRAPFVTRRTLLASAAATLAATSLRAQTGPAANWPDRNVRVIIPYPAGGSTDVLSRIIGEGLKDKLGQSFVIENRPGAGGNIGMAALVQSPPDGYTIGAATVGHYAINQYLYDKMPFDPEKDFITASLTWELPNVFVVATDHVPATTLKDFIAWAKSRPNIPFGSPGVGTTPHLSGQLFATRTGLPATHVPFRGAAQTIPAMLAGDVTYAIDNLASYISTIDSGKMRALAVTAAERWPTMPKVPTMAEAGVSDFVVTSWAGWVFPAGTPRPIVDKLSRALRDLAADPALQQRFLVAGAKAIGSTPEEADARAAKERMMWRDVIRISGAKAG